MSIPYSFRNIKMRLAALYKKGANMGKYTVASFFAGVGGIDLGFEATKKFQTIYANEIDSFPIQTFENNFNLKVDNRDITRVRAKEIPNFDIMVAGFPCQAFSLAGYRQGFDDEKGRGTLFFELIRILKEKQSNGSLPKVVFLENVKNLVSHDGGNTFQVIKDHLHNLGYSIEFQVLNACEYGNIPQNRERIYIVAFLNKNHYNKFHFPLPIKLSKKLSDVIEFNEVVEGKYYYTNKCKFYESLTTSITKMDTIYQWRRKYVRENKSKLCPTLTANMGTGGHNVPIILTTNNKIRKLTPQECFNLQGFPNEFKLPKQVSDTRLYKQAGNSVVVPVIERIATAIFNAMEE